VNRKQCLYILSTVSTLLRSENRATECAVNNFNTFLKKTIIQFYELYLLLFISIRLWTSRLYSYLKMVCATETCSPI